MWSRVVGKCQAQTKDEKKRWEEWKLVWREGKKEAEEQRRAGLILDEDDAVLATHRGTVLDPCRR